MMNRLSAGLLIEPGFSKQLFMVLILSSLFAVAIICYLPIQYAAKMLLILLILIWLLAVYHHHGHRRVLSIQRGPLQRGAIQRALLRSDNSWQLTLTNGQVFSAVNLSACFVQPWLTVLQFRLPNRQKVSLILLADNIDADRFRRLRVRLLHSPSG